MSKNALYITAIIALLLLNLVQLAGKYYELSPKDRPPADDKEGGELILRKLHFDRLQADQFKVMIDVHKGTVGDLRDQLYRNYTALYGVLKKDSNKPAIDSIQNEICGIYKAINYENIAHFEAVKKICRQDQLKNFDIFLDEMLERLGPGRK